MDFSIPSISLETLAYTYTYEALIGHFYATVLWQLVLVGHGQQMSY